MKNGYSLRQIAAICVLPSYHTNPECQPSDFLDLSYLMLLATLIQTLVLSVLLILLPLRFIDRRGPSDPRALKVKLACYFFAVGLGFMFIEVGFGAP